MKYIDYTNPPKPRIIYEPFPKKIDQVTLLFVWLSAGRLGIYAAQIAVLVRKITCNFSRSISDQKDAVIQPRTR
jgi:hypothetical protein